MDNYQSMDYYIERSVEYVKQGLAIGRSFAFSAPKGVVKNVVLAGLGGSGIGAELVHNYLELTIKVPVVISKDYFLPAFVNEDTLVIACSYSGNTEETLAAVSEARHKNAQILCITSGGMLKAFADEHQYDCIVLPSGIPPRAYVAGSFSQTLFALQHFGLINDAFISEIEAAADFLAAKEAAIKAKAEELAKQVLGKILVIYADQRIGGVATRWRQQLNENGKALGWERTIPEMNHNELVGWSESNPNLAVVLLHMGTELPNVKKRFAITAEVAGNCTDAVYDIHAEGNTFFEKTFYLMLLGDWLSWYLADMRGVDAVQVRVINYLKASLEAK